MLFFKFLRLSARLDACYPQSNLGPAQNIFIFRLESLDETIRLRISFNFHLITKGIYKIIIASQRFVSSPVGSTQKAAGKFWTMVKAETVGTRLLRGWLCQAEVDDSWAGLFRGALQGPWHQDSNDKGSAQNRVSIPE